MILCHFVICLWLFVQAALLTPVVIALDGDSITDEETIVKAETTTIFDRTNHRELGRIRYYYDTLSGQNKSKGSSSYQSCSTIFILGVGTDMTVTDYKEIATRTVQEEPSIVVIISDHNVHNFMKTSVTKYALLVNAIGEQIQDLIPTCSETEPNARQIIIGGHSASGQVAIEAFQQNLLVLPIHGLVGLDPFEIAGTTVDESRPLAIPALYWGFTETTCLVDTKKAAEAAYDLTVQESRILYLLHNTKGGEEETITHCAFTDHGCGTWPLLCQLDPLSAPWIHMAVAKSIRIFTSAIHRGDYHKQQFQMIPEIGWNKISLFVNRDLVLNQSSSDFKRKDFIQSNLRRISSP